MGGLSRQGNHPIGWQGIAGPALRKSLHQDRAGESRWSASPDAKLDVTVVDRVLKIRSDKFARAVTLTGDADGDPFGWFFDDNYFDLMPGETKTVRIFGRHTEGRVTAKAWYSPHATTVEWARSTRRRRSE